MEEHNINVSNNDLSLEQLIAIKKDLVCKRAILDAERVKLGAELVSVCCMINKKVHQV